MAPAEADIAAVRAELADLLRAVEGLRSYAYNPTPGEVHFPAAVVMDVAPRYNATLGAGMTGLTSRVMVSVGGPVTRATQEKLDGLLANSGAQSIRAALEDAEPFEAFDDLAVVGYDPVGFEDVAELGFYGGVFTVDVLI